MDPFTLLSLLGGGASLLGGIFGGIGDAQAGAAESAGRRRQAARLEDLAELLSTSDTRGLRGAASRQLSNAAPALNAQLMQRGVFDSGAGLGMQQQLTGDVMSQLAQQINEDELRRLLAQIQTFSGEPFGHADVPPSAYLLGGLGSALGGAGQGLIGVSPFLNNNSPGGGRGGGMFP